MESGNIPLEELAGLVWYQEPIHNPQQ